MSYKLLHLWVPSFSKFEAILTVESVSISCPSYRIELCLCIPKVRPQQDQFNLLKKVFLFSPFPSPCIGYEHHWLLHSLVEPGLGPLGPVWSHFSIKTICQGPFGNPSLQGLQGLRNSSISLSFLPQPSNPRSLPLVDQVPCLQSKQVPFLTPSFGKGFQGHFSPIHWHLLYKVIPHYWDSSHR